MALRSQPTLERPRGRRRLRYVPIASMVVLIAGALPVLPVADRVITPVMAAESTGTPNDPPTITRQPMVDRYYRKHHPGLLEKG
jgi:hypothetical protein